MSALGSLVVKLALDHAEYTQGLDRSSQEALKFAKRTQDNMDQAANSTKEFLGNVALNVAGAITSIVGLNAAFSQTREAINILASLDDAAQKTGSSIQDLSRIEQVARNFGDAFAPIEQGITRLAKGLAQIDDPGSDAIRALNAIGVSARDSDGQLRKSADVYIDVAKSLQQYEDGAQKTAVANALFGKSGADLLPVLNNLAQGIDDVSAVSEQSTRQADEFNNAVARSKARVNAFFTSLAVELLPTLNNIAAAVNNSSSQFGVLNVASGAASAVLKGLAIAAFTVVDTFRGMGREIGARAAQLASLAQLDFSGAKFIGQALAEDNARSIAEYDKFVDTILNGEKRISQSVDGGGTKKVIAFQANIPPAVDAATRSIEKQNNAFDIELVKLKQYESEARRARDITDSVATKQERYNQTLEELERLKPYLSVESYTRALDKAERELQDVGTVNKQVTSEMDQLWIQAGRNIQSTFANSIFDFFNDGLDSMWRNAKSAAGRILSEFAALRLSQGIGLSALFSVPGTAAASNVSSAGGVGAFGMTSLGSSALNLFKGGFGIPNMIGNLGSSLPGSAGSFFTGMAGKTATQLAAESGAMGLWGASGASTGMAASMGSAFAAAAGPAMIAFAVTQGLKALAGDKRLGGGFGNFMNKIGDIPILGDLMPVIPLINALFGRGPLKQKETSLTGSIGLEGFESGMLQTRFKAQGGLVRSDKTDFARVDAITGEIWTDNQKQLGEFAKGLSKAAQEIFGAFNDTAKQTSTALNQVGSDLGLSTDALKDFHYEINLISEKGKALTEEQIGKEIENLTDAMARKLLPQVDELARRGETALQTVSRLGTEFTSLVDTATMVLGKSAADARTFIQGFDFGDRTAFVDAAGGVDALNQKVGVFFNNLDDSDKLTVLEDRLGAALKAVGVDFIPTMEQFNAAMRSGQLTTDQFIAGLDLQGMIKDVNGLRDAVSDFGQTAEQAAAKYRADIAARREALGAERGEEKANRRAVQQNVIDAREQFRQRSIQADIDAAEKAAQRERDLLKLRFDVEQKSLDEAKRKSSVITGLIDSLGKAAFSASPLSFDDSRNIITGAIGKVRGGADFESIMGQRLDAAIGGAGSIDERLYSTYDDFARARGEAASQLNELAALGGNQLDVDHMQLSELEKQSDLMRQTYDVLSRRIDSGLEFDKVLAQADPFKGINSAQGTAKQVALNAANRKLFVLENDLQPSSAEVTGARINRLRTIMTPETVFGGAKMDPELLETLKKLATIMKQNADAAEGTEKILNRVTGGGDFMKTA